MLAKLPPEAKPTTPAANPAGATRIDDEERQAKEAEEKSAAGKLTEAKTLLRQNQREKAIEKLERLVIEHPDTKAAAEAKTLLRDLKK